MNRGREEGDKEKSEGKGNDGEVCEGLGVGNWKWLSGF